MTDASAYQSGITTLPVAVDYPEAKIVIREALLITIGGTQYTLGWSSRCAVCNCPWRMEIEQMLIPQWPMAMIEKVLYTRYGKPAPGNRMEHINRRSIANHAKRHSPAHILVRNAVTESHLTGIGKSIEDVVDTVVDANLFGKQVIGIAYERMMKGDIAPTISDAATFIKLAQDQENAVDAATQSRLFSQAMTVMMETVRAETSDAIYTRILTKLGLNAELRSIINQAAAIEAQATETN